MPGQIAGHISLDIEVFGDLASGRDFGEQGSDIGLPRIGEISRRVELKHLQDDRQRRLRGAEADGSGALPVGFVLVDEYALALFGSLGQMDPRRRVAQHLGFPARVGDHPDVERFARCRDALAVGAEIEREERFGTLLTNRDDLDDLAAGDDLQIAQAVESTLVGFYLNGKTPVVTPFHGPYFHP